MNATRQQRTLSPVKAKDQTTDDKQKRLVPIGCILCVVVPLALVVALFCWDYFTTGYRTTSLCSWIPPSPLRVEYDHGINLPKSARNFQCRTSGIVLDRTAKALFEINRRDLDAFLDQFPDDVKARRWTADIRVVVDEAEFKRPWKSTPKTISQFESSSPTGDFVLVHISEIPAGVVVYLYTDWN